MTPIDFHKCAIPSCFEHDEIIDVRSPLEFKLDHIPGAINLPVLNDLEREETGTVYKQRNHFEARKLGAAYITRNVGQILDTHFQDKTKFYKPFLYCWRGGQRSQSLATILSAIGWRVSLLEGGYKTYRTEVLDGLKDHCQRLRFFVLGGMTGSGKTHILHAINRLGGQVLDLEYIANHRGSTLGELPDSSQPSQKYFESCLFHQIRSFDPGKPVWVEAESYRIGDCRIPTCLWEQLKSSSFVELVVPRIERAQFLSHHYAHYQRDIESLFSHLSKAKRFVGSGAWKVFQKHILDANFSDAVETLLEFHYDPAYLNSTRKWFQSPSITFQMDSFASGRVGQLARKCMDWEFAVLNSDTSAME